MAQCGMYIHHCMLQYGMTNSDVKVCHRIFQYAISCAIAYHYANVYHGTQVGLDWVWLNSGLNGLGKP